MKHLLTVAIETSCSIQ